MHSHGLRQFIDKKSVGNCESNCCKLIIKNFFSRLVAARWNWQVFCNLLISCNGHVKLTTCNKPVAFFGCVYVRCISLNVYQWCLFQLALSIPIPGEQDAGTVAKPKPIQVWDRTKFYSLVDKIKKTFTTSFGLNKSVQNVLLSWLRMLNV